MNSVTTLVDTWLARGRDASQLEWLARACESASSGAPGAQSAVYLAFSQVPRRLGTGPLELDSAAQAAARALQPGWQPERWSVDQLGRARIALALGTREPGAYVEILERLWNDADLGEQIALYQALAVLPRPELFKARAAEGIRSNMKAVYEAVALFNPYPAAHLDAAAFNQLVLKCLFVDSRLSRIWGIDGRLSPELGSMLCDYAKERWAASRAVPLELWRCVGPVASGDLLAIFERALSQGSAVERRALVLSGLKNPELAELLRHYPVELEQAKSGALNWEQL